MRFWVRLLYAFSLLCAAQSLCAQTIMEKLVTPGPLSTAHAKLESKCSSCHSSFSREAQNGKCLSCHKGIAADVQKSQGFHGKSTAKSQACKTCHSEHHGRKFALIAFKRAGFNHNLTDYPLLGGHAKATCNGCHGTNGQYRGTTTVCATCHAKKDPHLGRLGRNCQSCHTVFDWKKPLPFNHNSTGFALTGQHRSATCMSCHAGQRWQGLPQTCIGCHAKNDVHKGTRGINCAACHSTADWKSATFNHARDANFPLLGRHGSISCAGCHGVNNAIRKPARTCIGCHAKDDTHKGSRGTNCSECHSPSSWKTVNFNHNEDTRFKLVGAHQTTACAGCHGVNNAIKTPPMTCIGCHQKDDKHQGRNGPECAKCHNSKDWKITAFNHDTMTRFPLKGAHKPVLCEACHKEPAHVKLPPTECVGCHADDDAHSARLGPNCGSCHNVDSWKEGILFDHELSRFPLAGKHAGLTCVQCHADKSFASKGITCQSCHKDDHHAGSLGATPSCAKCHNVNGWKIWTFDHDVQTAFKLTGRHQGLVCAACHRKGTEPRDTSSECGSCHQRDDVHRGNFGPNCDKCHTTDNFKEIFM